MLYKNYRNKYNRRRQIYSYEDIMKKSLNDIFENENDYLAQYNTIGIPRNSELEASVNTQWVEPFTNEAGEQDGGYWESIATPTKQYTNPDFSLKSNNDKIVFSERENSQGALQKVVNPIKDKIETVFHKDKDDISDGSLTGMALPVVDRMNEKSWERQNNDDLFEAERQKTNNILMQYNGDKNKDRPDAKLFMDLALIGPKCVPSCRDYHFISSDKVEEFNKELQLEGNKKIDSNYDGFIFSKESGTAQRLNASEEFRQQILREDNYDEKTGKFKRDKLEIELKNDKNLHYSFGHMTVIPQRVTDDGYLEGIGYDKYNFEHLEPDGSEAVNYNNKAKILQDLKHLKNYFVFVPIRVKIY